jgi:hypothetical protein
MLGDFESWGHILGFAMPRLVNGPSVGDWLLGPILVRRLGEVEDSEQPVMWRGPDVTGHQGPPLPRFRSIG